TTTSTDFVVGGRDRTKDDKFTYRVGANYVFDSGLAPYVQYATSFQPVSGVDIRTGQPFVPTTGDQIEAGVKFDGRGLGPDTQVFASAAVYRIVQDNVSTSDPSAP